MTRLILKVLNACAWAYHKARGQCHPHCDYSKCVRAPGPDTSFDIRLVCPRCGKVTRC